MRLLWPGADREETRDFANRNLIRVDWPAVHHEEIIARVKKSEGNKQFQPMCISRISHPDSHDDIFSAPLMLGSESTADSSIDPFESPRCSIAVPGADARSERGYHLRSLDGVTPEIIDRTRGRCVNRSNKWGKNRRTLE
ncbi:MAG TPA: hypothetical protein VLB06_04995 [Sulfuricaulis sp.]|nr:hypothetical protein [Sulfuricaulis sp.]